MIREEAQFLVCGVRKVQMIHNLRLLLAGRHNWPLLWRNLWWLRRNRCNRCNPSTKLIKSIAMFISFHLALLAWEKLMWQKDTYSISSACK